MTSIRLEPIYNSLTIAILAAVVIAVVLVAVTPPTVNRSHRRWLVGLRTFAATILALLLFRPALLRTDNRPADAALIVAADTSRSMTLPDGDGSTRWETQTKAWEKLATGVEQISRGESDSSLELQLLAYDAVPRNLQSSRADALASIVPDGELTDLSAAALATIQASQGRPLAGVVLLGDGTQTAPVTGSGAQRVAETLRSLGVPLWTVPIGPAGGESASRDVAIDSLPESFQLFAGNEVEIPFQVRLQGMSGVDVPVELSWIDLEGNITDVASRIVSASKASEVEAFSVSVTAPPPGTYRLKVSADPQEGEVLTSNNTQTAFVDVREGGGRILYLEGTPRLEQTFLRRSLRRFPDLDLTYRWIPADTADRWPIDLEELAAANRFDIYIIGDLNARAIGEQQLAKIATAVQQGAGLITLGGYESYGPGGYADSPLAKVLPVPLDPNRSADAAQIDGPLSIQLANLHPITDIGGDDPQQRWQQLPPLTGANRLQDPKVAPGVRVLLETEDNSPLLVIGQYGRGRVAASAMDSTWRWWRSGESEAHRRFWRQLILWLLSREESSEDRIVVEMESRRFAATESTAFTATVQSLDDDNNQSIQLVAEVLDAAGETTVVDATQVIDSARQSESSIKGSLADLSPGFYQLRVRPADSSSPVEAESMSFQVVDESREMAQPMADLAYLRQLAEQTADFGGAAFPPDQIDDLIETIRSRRKQSESPIVDKFRLGDGPISGWILFLSFTTTLGIEWYLRRRWGLV